MTGLDFVWRSFHIPPTELCLAKVLRCGQAFRWKSINNVWSCSLGRKVVFLKQEGGSLLYTSYPDDPNLSQELKDYLNLDIKVTDLYSHWSKTDAVFRDNAVGFEGVRMLRQDPWENLISFICSTNNNIKRISKMCDNLCIYFGDFIVEHQGIKYYTFPDPARLSHEDIEMKLRDLGFGYRAKFINKTAQMVSDSAQDLFNLRQIPYEEAHQELLKFVGVGPKVADCVCLMSLDKHSAIPVDTHVYQIAKRDYKLKSKGDVVTNKNYHSIQEFFVKIWGPYAGWAQSVLFAADLRDLDNGVNRLDVGADSGTENVTFKPTKVVIKEEQTRVKEELEIEYSITGRPKRRKLQVKVEVV